jgi:hypothetical protein
MRRRVSDVSGGGGGGGGGAVKSDEATAALMKLNRELQELSERAGSNPAASPPSLGAGWSPL